MHFPISSECWSCKLKAKNRTILAIYNFLRMQNHMSQYVASFHRLCARVFVYFLTPPPPFLVSVGTWVTFGGQITDEVRADGFSDLPSVKAYKWNPPYDRIYSGLPKKPIFTQKHLDQTARISQQPLKS